MRLRELADLPPVLRTAQVAELLGISAWKLGQMTREGTIPAGLEPLKFGRAWRWPTAAVLETIGLTHTNGASPESPFAQSDDDG